MPVMIGGKKKPKKDSTLVSKSAIEKDKKEAPKKKVKTGKE